jgi:ectoine hydroxylase-related dioxygenase (phytanoyl-CoA dioxygenase family)
MQVVKVEPTVSIWKGAEEAVDPLAEIRRLGLEKNVLELDAHGYTVVGPELVRDPGFADELREAIFRVAEARSGVRPDYASGASHRDLPTAAGQHIYKLLVEGREFERAVTNETALALIEYLCGGSCLISSMTAMVKGPGKVKLDLHADMLMMPPPYPAWSAGANATWILSPYSRENGSTCFWPGSHKLCRQPTPAEREDTASLVPIEAEAGSLLVWHTNTWHGAFARTAPGLRVNLIMYFCRPFMLQQEAYRDAFADEALERNGPRFARLIGKQLPFPMDAAGPDRGKLAHINAAVRTQWG